MRILVACDKFKESLSVKQACHAVKNGILKYNPEFEVFTIPLADGGEGSLEVLEETLKFNRIYVKVHDPLFRLIDTWYALLNKTAYIQMSKASGLMLLANNERNPLKTTTLGTGELIMDALKKGTETIYLFVGGSDTNDVGIGVAKVLGYRFLDKYNNELLPIGESLVVIFEIDKSN